MQRKLLVGPIVSPKVESREIREKTLKQWLHSELTNPADLALFELESR